MKKLVIPTILGNVPENKGERPDRLLFIGENNTCGGHVYCAGRRIIENSCHALQDAKGYRGMDSQCVITMIKIQLEALNNLLGIKKTAREKQRIRVEDVEEILNVIDEENRMCLKEGEPALSRQEAFKLVTDLLLEKLFVDKVLCANFFGMLSDVEESTPFKDLEPRLLNKIKLTLMNSAKLLFPPN